LIIYIDQPLVSTSTAIIWAHLTPVIARQFPATEWQPNCIGRSSS